MEHEVHAANVVRLHDHLSVTREANHRIANNLALIAASVRLTAQSVAKRATPLPPEEANWLLVEAAARIEAVATLHRLLSARHSRPVDIGEHLSEVCRALLSSLPGSGKIALTHDLPSGHLIEAEQAGVIALIIGEAVTNAVKYAHPSGIAGHIDVACSASTGRLTIEVCDDGVGLPTDFDPARNGGIGFHLMRSFASQLGAQLDFNSTDLGLKFRLILPAG